MAYIYVETGTDGFRSFVERIRVNIDFIHTFNLDNSNITFQDTCLNIKQNVEELIKWIEEQRENLIACGREEKYILNPIKKSYIVIEKLKQYDKNLSVSIDE